MNTVLVILNYFFKCEERAFRQGVKKPACCHAVPAFNSWLQLVAQDQPLGTVMVAHASGCGSLHKAEGRLV